MQARYYDPIAGRFLSTDPIGYQDQLNLYAYVHNDPVNATDPMGLAADQGTDVQNRTLSKKVVITGSRLPRQISVSVKSNLSDSQLSEVASQIPDTFFINNAGKDFTKYDTGKVGLVSASGVMISEDKAQGNEEKRGKIQIANQLSRGLFGVKGITEKSRNPNLYYAPYGGKGGFTGMRWHDNIHIFPIGMVSFAETLATVTHERLHLTSSSGFGSAHQAIYNEVYDNMLSTGYRRGDFSHICIKDAGPCR